MKYAWLTIKHKWFVLLAGLKIGGIPFWRLLIHDWTKFLPSELPHYQRQFFGKADDGGGFIACWTRHQNRHPHHWEYWIPRTGHSRCDPPYCDNEPIPMPEWAVREMVADWMAAGRAYEGSWPIPQDWQWLKKNLHRICQRLHRDSQRRLRTLLHDMHVFPQPCDYLGVGCKCSRPENVHGVCEYVNGHDGWSHATYPCCPFGRGVLGDVNDDTNGMAAELNLSKSD